MKKLHIGDKAAMRRYGDLLADIKTRIRQAQNRAVMSANAELIRLIYDIQTRLQDTESWCPEPIELVPAPKNQRWRFRHEKWEPCENIAGIVANNGQFGGSSFFMPFRETFHRQVFHLHGQPQATIAFAEISPQKLVERPSDLEDENPAEIWKTPLAGWEAG